MKPCAAWRSRKKNVMQGTCISKGEKLRSDLRLKRLRKMIY